MGHVVALELRALPGVEAGHASALPLRGFELAATTAPGLADLLTRTGGRRRSRTRWSVPAANVERFTAALHDSPYGTRADADTDLEPGDGYGLLHLEPAAAGGLTVRIHTDGLDATDPQHGIRETLGRLDLLDPAAGRPARQLLTGYDTVRLAGWAEANDLAILDPSGTDSQLAARLRETAATSCVLLSLPGAPARGQAVVGDQAFRARGLLKRPRGGFVGEVVTGTGTRTMIPSPDQIARLRALPRDRFHTEDHLGDVLTMHGARPYTGDTRLRDYQQAVVGLQLTTRYGLVNAMDPGMGKTITTLTAWRVRATDRQRWCGLVVVEAAARDQWVREAAEWFPQADVHLLLHGDRTPDLGDEAGPALLITTYQLVVRSISAALDGGDAPLGRWLLEQRFDDLAADEAVGLRNPRSRTSRALWALRQQAEVAVALTGTPTRSSLDELGAVLAWTRNRPELTGEMPWSRRFDLTSPRDRRRLLNVTGPLLVRRTKSAIADELPQVVSEVCVLPPSVAETDLASAVLERVRTLDSELAALVDGGASGRDPRVRTLRATLLSAWPTVLACADPAGLDTSTSELVAGLPLHDAVAAGTKRRFTVERVTVEVAAGRQVLVFAARGAGAKRLVRALRDAGHEVGEALGGGGSRRDADLRAFASGELDVLVAGAVAERGLNLQAADVVIHHDLPSGAAEAVQRIGRVDRLGAEAATVTVVYPVLDTPVERLLADTVVAAADQALDAARTGQDPTAVLTAGVVELADVLAVGR